MEENAEYYGIMLQAEEESLAAKEGVSDAAAEEKTTELKNEAADGKKAEVDGQDKTSS